VIAPVNFYSASGVPTANMMPPTLLYLPGAAASSLNMAQANRHFYPPAPRQPSRRLKMGVRIVLADKEPIQLALKRFKKSLERHGVKWEQRRRGHFIEATQMRRAKKFQKRFKARRATLLAQKAGEQPVGSIDDAVEKFWERTGKP
jgi:small subunit ribosomal protein S21